MTKKLTAKQERFVAEYLVDLNATQAAIRAGYSAKTAGAVGFENLKKPEIAAAIAIAMKAREQRTHITQDRVLQELARIAFFDIRKLYRGDGTLKAMQELDDDAAAVLAGVDVQEVGGAAVGGDGGVDNVAFQTKKVKIPDKVGALGLAMRHLGMFKDKVDLSVRVQKVQRTIVDPSAAT
ncbi:terminase small subunit [Variovorax sp. DAIF25]|uniref:terminase small subunit n=1 Tax=Variovorax sp. DAIF25 TaxID=3080983 RepID=UPI003D6A37B2